MENPLLVLPQSDTSISRVKALYKIMKSANKEGAKLETKIRGQEKRNRLSLLLQKPEFHSNVNLNKFEKLTKASSESPEEVKKWGESFDKLISQRAGLDAFTRFLKTEFSEENIAFWVACEDYKTTEEASQLSFKAKIIYETFVEKDAPKEVNLDFNTKEYTRQSISNSSLNSFDVAQTKIYTLMEQDSYPRFLRSNVYLDLINSRPPGCSALRRRSRSFTFNEFKDAQPDFAIWL